MGATCPNHTLNASGHTAHQSCTRGASATHDATQPTHGHHTLPNTAVGGRARPSGRSPTAPVLRDAMRHRARCIGELIATTRLAARRGAGTLYWQHARIIGQAAMVRRMATSSICSVGGRATRARGQRASIGVRLVDGLALYHTYECIG